MLVTETCLLDERRNPTEVGETPAAKKARIEAMLKAATGARTVIWLYGSSSPHDITTGHVDAIARFIKPGVVVLQEPNDEAETPAPISSAIARRSKMPPMPTVIRCAWRLYMVRAGTPIGPQNSAIAMSTFSSSTAASSCRPSGTRSAMPPHKRN